MHRIYSLYSYVTGRGAHRIYILADEDGTKMEMTIHGCYEDKFRGLEKQEGKWVEIFRVEVNRAYPGFKATNSLFRLTVTSFTKIHIIAPLNNRLYMDFKNIHDILHMHNRDQDYPINTMGMVFNTEVHFDDLIRPEMVFYIRDNIESQIKCVETDNHAYAFRDGLENMRGRGPVIVFLKMWRFREFFGYLVPPELWLETEGGLSDFRFNPLLPEVEEFRQSVNNSDRYVWRHGAIGSL